MALRDLMLPNHSGGILHVLSTSFRNGQPEICRMSWAISHLLMTGRAQICSGGREHVTNQAGMKVLPHSRRIFGKLLAVRALPQALTG